MPFTPAVPLDLPTIPAEYADPYYAPPTNSTGFSFSLWEALCYDIALGVRDTASLLADYGLDEAAYAALVTNPHFKKMLAAKREEVAGLGTDAATVAQYRIVAATAAPELQRRLLDPATNNRDFVSLLSKVIEMARLAPQKDEKAVSGGAGLTVVFNSVGVPGLEHLNTTPAPPAPEAIEAVSDAVVIDDNTQQAQSATQPAPPAYEPMPLL